MKHFAIVLGLIALFLFFSLPNITSEPFTYDEADYMYAAERGFLANYIDSPSLSFPDYVRLGLSRGSDNSQNARLSRTVRRAGDMFLYRHAHGPVYFYWLDVLSHWSSNENFIRGSGLVFPIVTAIAIYLGCLWVLPPAQGFVAAVLGCAMFLLSPAVIRTTEVAPHLVFTMWFIVSLLLLAKLLATGERRFWYAAVCITALSFCTLEVTFVLIAVVLLCGYLERQRLGLDWQLAGKSALLFAGIVVALHPAAITKLAFAKSYLLFAYLALERKGPWGNATFLDTWVSRFENSPVEWLLVVAAVFLWIRYRGLSGHREALPFLIFGGLMMATMIRVYTVRVRYVLPFLPALLVFAAFVLSGVLMRWKPAMRAAFMALLVLALVFNTQRFSAAHPYNPDPHASMLITQVNEQNLGDKRLLVPHDDLPTLHYYFPNADLTAYTDGTALPAGQFDAIVRPSDPVRIDLVSK